jgi:hypothetical protein
LDGSGDKRCERRCQKNAKDSVHSVVLILSRGRETGLARNV